jgi:hypothetical protein
MLRSWHPAATVLQGPDTATRPSRSARARGEWVGQLVLVGLGDPEVVELVVVVVVDPQM